jgi:nitrilase
MVVAGLDMEAIPESRLDFNAAGHYNRPDVFRLDVPDQPETIIPTNRNSKRIT